MDYPTGTQRVSGEAGLLTVAPFLHCIVGSEVRSGVSAYWRFSPWAVLPIAMEPSTIDSAVILP